MFNYMSILGWSPGNDLEIFDKEFAINNFDLKNVLANQQFLIHKSFFG